MNPPSSRPFADETVFREIVEGTAGETGQAFFDALVRSVARALGVYGCWVTEHLHDKGNVRAIAFWLGDDWVGDYEYAVAGTPCEDVLHDGETVYVPDRVIELFPDDDDMARFGGVSYIGVPFQDGEGNVIGHLAAFDRHPLEEDPRILAIFRIFANRAAAELRRLRAETQVREREQKLGRLVDSAMDAIVELDSEMRITRTNPAARKVFRVDKDALAGARLTEFVTAQDDGRVRTLFHELKSLPEGSRYLWIPGGLRGRRADGEEFPAEATMSSFESGGETFYTIILRDVNARRLDEQRIRSLTSQAEYLRREVQELQNFGEIIGESPALARTIQAIRDVAATDTTALLLGETGTGKELFAQAIHAESPRAERPLVRVNCAALPASLIESELFGHEKGAFTGATQRREGRFALADRGTIFLDEVGELPLDLQSKLLRVLQEGEFEPVGSSRTRTVDVRVIAATNRDLERCIADGTFREDLFYRLNVFPIRVPPLRDRGDDVVLLAGAFAGEFARRFGRAVDPLAAEDERRLRAYEWPGNVRELRNVIERAVITARDGRLDLGRLLPLDSPEVERASPGPASSPRVLNAAELVALEKDNLLRALEQCNWKVSGRGGAAETLDLPASTVHSRMKALGVRRPG